MTGDAYPLEPPDVSKVPNAEPRIEPPSRSGNRSTYEVWGKPIMCCRMRRAT